MSASAVLSGRFVVARMSRGFTQYRNRRTHVDKGESLSRSAISPDRGRLCCESRKDKRVREQQKPSGSRPPPCLGVSAGHHVTRSAGSTSHDSFAAGTAIGSPAESGYITLTLRAFPQAPSGVPTFRCRNFGVRSDQKGRPRAMPPFRILESTTRSRRERFYSG